MKEPEAFVGIPSKITSGVPDKTVRVNEGSVVHAGQGDDRAVYTGGQTVTIAGPEADDLILAGYVTYV